MTTMNRPRQSSLTAEAVNEISEALRQLLADIFCLYLKTKSFHWHMSGRHFRDYHLLFDEQAEEIFAMTDVVAERARKIGGTTLRSISEIARRKRLHDNDQENLAARSMVSELRDDNARLTGFLRETHEVCATHDDVASTSLIETWIDPTERRTWFLSAIAEGV